MTREREILRERARRLAQPPQAFVLRQVDAQAQAVGALQLVQHQAGDALLAAGFSN